MAHFDLENYYRTMFSLFQIQSWPMEMIGNWTPYERELYTYMLSEHIEDEKTKQRNNQS